MTALAAQLGHFLDRSDACALVEISSVQGSAPREAGAWMLVSQEAIFGTIGGGQLEYMAIDKAREMLQRAGLPLIDGEGGREAAGWGGLRQPLSHPLRHASRGTSPIEGEEGEMATLSVPLGPEIGQCCGGRVDLTISVVDEAVRERLVTTQAADDRARPHVYLFGGGHVGHALALALTLLPVHVVLVETREDALDGIPEAVETRLTPVPEQAVRDAPSGSAFLILTHDHALDFLIAAEALKRDDAAYVGMIGSKTKRATFRNWYLRDAGGGDAAFGKLVCPIGGANVRDKRPAVIAAMAAAEVMVALPLTCNRARGLRQTSVRI
jgi:xanthine dehydrogenase accessory factor